jgi:benzoyl-CoA reductase/2-hydroxyglutaryl-CoA dehydratase subunit BcrC/BadD/HgdB
MEQAKRQYDEESKYERKRERLFRHALQVANRFMRRALDLAGIPCTMEYFTNILKRIFIDLQGVENPSQVKTIGTYCVMIPQELIYAAGAMPVKLCSGSYTGFNVGDETCPRDSCPLVKASLGCLAMDLMPIYSECALSVIPASCDCKKKLTFLMAPYTKTLAFHVPTLKIDDGYKADYINDLYLFKQRLEKVTGNKITYVRLKTAILALASAQQEIHRFYRLKMHQPAVIKGTHAMMVINSYSYERVDKWTRALRILNDELEMRIINRKFVAKENAPRLMLTGAPVVFPNIKVPLLLEEMGGVIVADETCMGERGLYDPASVTESSVDGMMRSLAVRQILPCTCPTFVQNDQRIFKLKQMAEDFKVDGVIYHVLRGCLVYDFEFPAVEAALGELGIPVIRLETDYNEEDVEQLRVRLEAFIEMIKYQKEETA